MKNTDTTIQVNIDWRMITIVLVLVLLAAGAWSAYASPASQGSLPDANAASLDAAAAPVQPIGQGDPNAGPGEPDQAGDVAGQPTSGDPNAAAAAEQTPPEVPEMAAALGGTVNGSLYYLTDFNVAPASAKTACATGYHMASLWELYDLSNHTYNYSHPDAYTKTDSGFGPPAYWYGWIRTGYDSSSTATAGIGNCSNWTQNTTGSGSIARLNRDWNVSAGGIDPWEPDPWTCTGIAPVWCVGN